MKVEAEINQNSLKSMAKIHKRLYYLRRFCRLSISLIALIGCAPGVPETGPLQVGDALTAFDLEPGFKIEILAAEPLVSDPVDMEIDEYGNLYVLEMHGYPLDKSGLGQIKLLKDKNGDGEMDESTVFADGLTLPFGLMRWKKGILVADAPDLLYLEDTTMDGRADIREVMLTGFAFSNAQMNAGNPLYGLDNWIYLTSESGGTYQIYNKEFGDLGEDIHYPGVAESPRLPLAGTGRTVRIRPDLHKLELTSGKTQFGHAFDIWGHHLMGNNSNHIYHEVVAGSYLSRNPDLLVSDATQTLSDHGSEVFPITKNPEHQLLTSVGIFTSACGNTLYTGGSFPPPYNDKVHFVAEPVSNIVHADILRQDGASFLAGRFPGQADKEFLASTDSWFRPVNMYVGPDGALYLLDYYRQIIEHPEWMSEDAVKAGHLYNGMDKGRIYRISPTDAAPPRWTKGLALGDATDEELVAELANPNSWWRLNAQRLLIDRRAEQAIPLLVKVAGDTSAMGRLHALWTLEGMEALSPDLIETALQDSVAGIRENAVKLADLYYLKLPSIQNRLLSMQDDPDPKVRFQLLCTLGSIDTPQSGQVRNALLFKDLEDKWAQVAALTATSSESTLLLNVLVEKYKHDVPAYSSMITRLSAIIGATEEPGVIRGLVNKAIKTISDDDNGWQAAVLGGLAQGLDGRTLPTSPLLKEQPGLIKAFFEHPSPAARQAALRLLTVTGIGSRAQLTTAIEKAATIAQNSRLSDERRSEAINFLALGDPASHTALLKKLVAASQPQSVQVAALNILSLIPGQTVTEYSIGQWSTFTPEIRRASVNTFLTSRERMETLLNAIDSGMIQKTSITFEQSVRLMTQRDEKLRARARAMFAHNDAANINKDYQEALALKGNVPEGKRIFSHNCAMCHQVKGADGESFGPDLGTVYNWQPEGVMANILAPNLSIAAGYELWSVETHKGESFQGIISSETPIAVTVKVAPNVEKTINRDDIKSLNNLNISGMPGGFENIINPQQMADLLAFLSNSK